MSHPMHTVGRLFGIELDPHRLRGRNVLLILACAAAFVGLLIAATSALKAFAIVVSLVVIAVAFTHPEYVALALAAYTPLEPFLLKFVSDELYVFARYFSESLIYILLASVLLRIALGKKKFVQTPLDVPFVFFILVAVTSAVVNAVPAVYAVLGLRQIIRFILLFFVIVQMDPEREFIRRVTKVMFGIVVFESLLGILQAVVGGPLDQFLIPSERRFYESVQLTSGTEQFWSPGSRIFATLGRYDQLGTFLCLFLLLVVGILYMQRSKELRRTLLFVLVAAIPALFLTLSRASWFGFVIGLLLIGAWLKKDWRIRIGFVSIVVAAVSYVLISGIVVRQLTDYAGQGPIERLFEAFSFERWRGEYYGLGRLYWIVQTPLVVVASAPVFGVGPGQYGGGAAAALGNTSVYDQLGLPFGVYGTDGYIDNNWFSLWGETGTLGLILYLAMFIALGRMAYDVWKHADDPLARGLALGYLGILSAVTFQAFLGTYLEVRTLSLYVWMYGGFIYVLGRRERLYA